MLDRQAADVHVLINDQNTGGGGDQYQLIFFGQNQFKNMVDTIRFINNADNTDFEERELLIKYLKLGLVPYLTRLNAVNNISISMKAKEEDGKTDSSVSTPIKDPWNYWVFRTGLFGYVRGDEVYRSSSLNVSISASRITEELKLGVEINAGKNKDSYELEDSVGNKEKIVTKNNNYNFGHYLVKSINDHWSVGYQTGMFRSTFSNNKNRLLFETGIEYNIFPYKLVNTKFFTFSYTFDVRRNIYFDTTLYNKTKETLWGHGLNSKFKFNQKWGSISIGAKYHGFLHNWKYFNLGIDGEFDIRITGGLSFNIYTSAELTRDQLYLPKEGASQQEVLTRQRQLASGYNFFTHFGINYRFGSKLNNFVNPRFD